MKLGGTDISKLYIGGTEITKAYLGAVEVYANVQPWDVSTAAFVQSFSVSAQHGFGASGVFFKPDGLKMYVIGLSSDDLSEYNLSVAWDISTASFLHNYKPFNTNPTGVFFKSDGLSFFTIGLSSNSVSEYRLSTAWDISTTLFGVFASFSTGSQDGEMSDIYFRSDGLKMYLVGTGGDAAYEYDLTTAWDISTASFSQSFSLALEDTDPTGIFFKPDGTKMFIAGDSSNSIIEYALGTPWDVSTASYSRIFSLGAQPKSLSFKPDGLKMYAIASNTSSVNEYNLGGA